MTALERIKYFAYTCVLNTFVPGNYLCKYWNFDLRQYILLHVLGFLVIRPFVPFDMTKADSEAEFSLAESGNEQNGFSNLNGNVMFHLLFFVVAVTESQWCSRRNQKNKGNFLCTAVSLHPQGFKRHFSTISQFQTYFF